MSTGVLIKSGVLFARIRYIYSWRLRVSELYWRQKFGIYRVIKEEKLDLSEAILRKSTLKFLTSLCRYKTLSKTIFGKIDFKIAFSLPNLVT